MLRRAFFCLVAVAALLGPGAAKASPALVFEPYNGTVFYAEDPDTLWFPASLTKMMTAYVAFHALRNGEVKPDTPAVVTKNALAQPPTKLGLPVGSSIPLETAIRVIIVKSANDVAVMVAETVGGSEEAFVERMNEAAKRLGMTSTQFANPHGLPNEQQYTTARDLGRLARALIIEFPEYADIFSMTSVSVAKRQLRTHNGLLRTFNGADGMKTGFICHSGFNIVVSATRDGRKLVAVVLGEKSTRIRNERAAQLLENGFKRYFWKSLFGTSLNGLPLPADRDDRPVHLGKIICGPNYGAIRPEFTPDLFPSQTPVTRLADVPTPLPPLN
ncbi:D-alanyl-D-alanine carboxypeptidase family protein [Methyloceanibacter sp. wino2]|uniref:D-alanyl-D-alanine carboxypeptidase family protein n=1 Tax=Methyloceanibacter sp. wino2 TaxID=2170729 RepID=UPI000D3E3122|nr:D-alanyl-D-alanine carboxypeptidase family protein [Methyloceanibacter sp. wino2]